MTPGLLSLCIRRWGLMAACLTTATFLPLSAVAQTPVRGQTATPAQRMKTVRM
jgi:hypothetical protein